MIQVEVPLGAGAHHLGKVAIGDNVKPVRAHRLGEALRHDEPVERKDAPLLRLDPEELARLPALRHREDADRIGPEENVRRQLEFARTGFHGADGEATVARRQDEGELA